MLCEGFDDRARRAAELAEHFNDRWAADFRSIGERYLKGYIELHLRVRIPEGYAFAILERLPVKGKCADMPASLSGFDAVSRSREVGSEQDELSVLVLPVEDMEGVEHVIPPLVRSERVDIGLIGGGEQPDVGSNGFLGQTSHRLRDGEISAFWFDGSVPCCQYAGKDVQAAALGVDDLTNIDLDASGDRFCYLEEEIFPFALGVGLGPQSVRLSLEKCRDLALKDISVAIRPLDFCSSVV